MTTELLPYVLLGYGAALVDVAIIAALATYVVRRRNRRQGAGPVAAPVAA